MGWVLNNLRLVIVLVSLLGLGGVYYYWKDNIEDTLLAKLRLDAMQASEVFKQERYSEAQRIIKDQAIREQQRVLDANKLLEYIERNANETSCLTKPLTLYDIGVLRDARNQAGDTGSTSGNDEPSTEATP